MAAKWLLERWSKFFLALEQATTEAEVKAICEAEIAAWKARPEIKSESTLRNAMTLTHKEIERRLTGDRQAWALTHMAFSRGWYIQHSASSQANLSERLEHQQLLKNPDAIVAKGDELLDSDYWPDVFVALLLMTGRRPIELYLFGDFEYCTEYSVKFSGQAKRRGDPLPAYEIPTLCRAQRVIDSLARIRPQIDTTDPDTYAITRKYSPLIRDAANRHFSDLVPARPSAKKKKTGPPDEGLYGQLFRAVYPRIAVFWYAPPTIDDRHFMAVIQGHRKHFEELETEEERISYSSGAHYSDYKIADAQGNIDGRQGLKLGSKGVELLEVFKPKSRRKEPMTTPTTDQAQEQAQAVKPEGRNVPVTVDRPTFNRVQALKTAKTHRTYSETVNLLLDSYEGGVTAPFSLSSAIRQLLASDEEYKKFSQEEETAEAVALLDELLADQEKYKELLVNALVKEAKFQVGLAARHAGKDFTQMTIKQLKGTRDKGATNERIRRAVLAIAAYNDAPGRAQAERWYLNATSVNRLVGGRYPIIGAYIKAHQSEIDALNDKHKLTDRYNNKPDHIEDFITVPDAPPPWTDQQQPETAATAEQEPEAKQQPETANTATE
jgi:hypothetical protein